MGHYTKIRYQPGGKMEFLREPYLVGILPNEKKIIDGKTVYIIEDKTIISFWKNTLNRLKGIDEIKSKIEKAEKEFIIKLEDDKLGIIHQNGSDRIEIYSFQQ